MNIRKVIRKKVRKVMDNAQSKNNVKDSYNLDGRKINSEIKKIQKSLKRHERELTQDEAKLKQYDIAAKSSKKGLDTVIRKIDGQPYTLRKFKDIQEALLRSKKQSIKIGKENIKKLEKIKGDYKSANNILKKEDEKWIEREKKGLVNPKENKNLDKAENEIRNLENEFKKIQQSNKTYHLEY